MTKGHLLKITGLHGCVLAGAATLMVALGGAAPALAKRPRAAVAEPAGEYAMFNQCPFDNPDVSACIAEQSTGGEFRIGKLVIPISRTITFQGGVIEGESGEESFVGATNGETLSKTALPVPGGLLGILAPNRKWPFWLRGSFNQFINRRIADVTATAELVGPPDINRINLVIGQGVALRLPERIHLQNPLLGDRCYIGSAADPIVLNLTTGITSPPLPNLPISGNLGELVTGGEGGILFVKKNVVVDNAYAAPAATGCGGHLSFLIDPVLNAKLGLPSPAGNNTAILNSTLETSGAEFTKEQIAKENEH